jgi:TPR repeat protein
VDSDGDGIPDAKDPYAVIADFYLLTWDVHSLRFGWSIQTEARVLEQSSLTWTAGRSETKIEGDKNVVQGTAGVDIVGRSGGTLNSNPLQAFGLLDFTASLEARAKAGISFQKEMEWGSKRQEETRRAAEYFSRMTKETRISDPFLSVWITFRNHSSDDLYLLPASLPVFASGQPVCSASVVERYGPEGLLIPADRPEGVEVEFRAPLDTTAAQRLLAGLGSGAPSVDLAKSRSVIRRSDRSGDAISFARRIEDRTVEISISSGDVRWSWRIAHQDARNLRPVTLQMALEAISARLSQELGPERGPLVVIKNSEFSQLAAIDIGDRASGAWEATVGGVRVTDLRQLDLDQPLRIGAPVNFAYRTSIERYQLAKEAVDSRDAAGIPSAVEELRELAEAGFAPAQRTYGVCFELGVGRPRDHSEAHRWYVKAAEQGNALAQHNIGLMYCEGRGVPKDDAQAVAWFRKAAEQGQPNGQFLLGAMYVEGRGVAKDESQAAEWFRKAAEQGNADAQNKLGIMYAVGTGVPKDETKAVEWFRKAAEQGLAVAQANLGLMRANGADGKKDVIEAYRWLSLAASQGFGESAKARDDLARSMTKEQIAIAERLAREFSPKLTPTGGGGN